jgi:hypothetical protein
VILSSPGANSYLSCQVKPGDGTGQSSEAASTNVHRVHSALFNISDTPSHRMTLIERAKRQGDIEMAEESPTAFFSNSGEVPTTEKFITDLTCKADAIVTEMVLDDQSFLSDDQEWVFTDYVVQVDEVVKDNPLRPISIFDICPRESWVHDQANQ